MSLMNLVSSNQNVGISAWRVLPETVSEISVYKMQPNVIDKFLRLLRSVFAKKSKTKKEDISYPITPLTNVDSNPFFS